ncbi:hypothetical protein [Nesterenkonia rhizosphaerae]|uniref:Uncharacterized protein n=1 Tax=Nesterenkonia rhizosphaerae TaxID=1348272 RepID=A0ABP9G2U4_9MICC
MLEIIPDQYLNDVPADGGLTGTWTAQQVGNRGIEGLFTRELLPGGARVSWINLGLLQELISGGAAVFNSQVSTLVTTPATTRVRLLGFIAAREVQNVDRFWVRIRAIAPDGSAHGLSTMNQNLAPGITWHFPLRRDYDIPAGHRIQVQLAIVGAELPASGQFGIGVTEIGTPLEDS